MPHFFRSEIVFFSLISSDYIFILNRDYCYEKKDCYLCYNIQ